MYFLFSVYIFVLLLCENLTFLLRSLLMQFKIHLDVLNNPFQLLHIEKLIKMLDPD